MPAAIRLGILGTARIVRRAILAGLEKCPSVQLVAVASRAREKAQALANEAGNVKAYDTYEALLADPEIDAVYLPLLNDLHHPWTLAAARRGKHVLCEKPLALNAREAEEMARVCAASGVLLMEAFMWRHHPRARRAKELVEEGAIGTLLRVEANFAFPCDPTEDAWLLETSRGGGALMDIGCYGVDASRYFLGGEPRVSRASAWRKGAEGVELAMEAELRFPGGASALVRASIDAPDRNELVLHGSTGRLEFPDAFLPGDEPVLHLFHDEKREVIPLPHADAYACELAHFAASIDEGRLLPPAEDGVDGARVLDKIRAAWDAN